MRYANALHYCTNAIYAWPASAEEEAQAPVLETAPVHPFVVYEHPLNERMRNLLRLEFLFRQAQHCQSGTTAWDSRLFIVTLLDILAILSRSDLKTELIKELERHLSTLGRLNESPDVDQQQLATILKHLEQLRGALHGTNGPLGQDLRDSEFLNGVRQRSTIPGGTCDFDLPAYHCWLNRPADTRREIQQAWLDSLRLTRQAVELLLKLVRNTAGPSHEVATAGGFQRNLDADLPFQLIRVAIDSALPYYAEISGGKHRFTIRFLNPNEGGRPLQATGDVPFRLSCCAL